MALEIVRRFVNGAWKTEAAEAGGGGARPFISDTETGIVVNRAGAFVSAWETFDLGEPGVGYAKMLVTAADPDGLVWATDIGPLMDGQVSADGVTWVGAFGLVATIPTGILASDAYNDPDPIGKTNEYVTYTPRLIRLRGVVYDNHTNVVYAGIASPSFTFDFSYAAS